MTGHRYRAPMPPGLRHLMRASAHPARSVACPHCGACPHHSCVLRKSGRELAVPHPVRVSGWAQQTACCPACQVEPTVPCHDDGIARATVHDRRITEAKETCA